MISDLYGSLGSDIFSTLRFASCACAFKSSGLITRLKYTSDLNVTFVFVAFE